MQKKRTLAGIIRLTRYQDNFRYAIVTTLLGILLSGAKLSLFSSVPRLALVLIANVLSVCFAFMINDIEDAEDDALTKSKAVRNPISSGSLSKRTAYLASFGVALISAGIFYLLGTIPFWIGLFSLSLGALYSWRVVRFKRVPIIDLISHGLMLAGLQLLGGFVAFAPLKGWSDPWIAPFVLVVAVSMYGEFFNEVRDLVGDRKAGVTHTVAFIGEWWGHFSMYTLLGIAGIALVYSVARGIIPLWLIIFAVIISVPLASRPLWGVHKRKGLERTGNLQGPAMTICFIGMSVWLAVRFFI